MRLALIGRYVERGILRVLRDEILIPAGHNVVSTWLDGPHETDAEMGDGAAARRCRLNRDECWLAEAIIYQPSAIPSPGRFVDLGMAYLLGRPVLVWGWKGWEELPAADRTIYLRGAIYATDETALLSVLSEWGA